MDNRNFKENVKTAAAYLAENGVECSHTRLLEAISRAFGERNWSTLSAQLKAGGKIAQLEANGADDTWSPTDGPMNEATYVANGGNLCPFCGSHNIEVDGVQADGPRTWDDNTCHDCDSTWSSAYSLSGYFDAKCGDAAGQGSAHSDLVEGLLTEVADHNDVIVLCAPWDDQTAWMGTVYPAKTALSTLAKTVPISDLKLMRTPSELLAAVAQDQSKAIDTLINAEVRFLSAVSRPDEPSAREAAVNACSGFNILQELREEVVNDIVDDVLDRARRHQFSTHGYDQALRLARESSEALNLDATDVEIASAANRLG